MNKDIKKKGFIGIFLILLLSPFAIKAEESDKNSNSRLPVKEINNFTQVFEQIRTGYVEEITDVQLLESAIQGMLENLDPHSAYLSDKKYINLQENASGEYGALGIEVIGEKTGIRVIAPIDDGPAFLNDIRAGDLIVEIDKAPVGKMNIRLAIDKLRGKKGTKIELTILREGLNQMISKTLIRDTIQISSVRSRLLHPNIGYIRIAQFQISSDEDFLDEYEKLVELNGKELEGLIIDLRNNPGGLVPPSITIADMLLSDGQIVYTQGRLSSANQEFYADPFDITKGIPIAVLINEGSASASEIVAGALQDNNRAVILGTRSFGKGSVQTVVPINESSAVKLTTALYFTPSGKSIQAAGIIPDIVIEPAEIRLYETFERAREENLSGHLSTDPKVASDETDKNTEENSTIKDNQLYEALNILIGTILLSDN